MSSTALPLQWMKVPYMARKSMMPADYGHWKLLSSTICISWWGTMTLMKPLRQVLTWTCWNDGNLTCLVLKADLDEQQNNERQTALQESFDYFHRRRPGRPGRSGTGRRISVTLPDRRGIGRRGEEGLSGQMDVQSGRIVSVLVTKVYGVLGGPRIILGLVRPPGLFLEKLHVHRGWIWL